MGDSWNIFVIQKKIFFFLFPAYSDTHWRGMLMDGMIRWDGWDGMGWMELLGYQLFVSLFN